MIRKVKNRKRPIDVDDLGAYVIGVIMSGGLLYLETDDDELGSLLASWSANAPEQIGECIKGYLRGRGLEL